MCTNNKKEETCWLLERKREQAIQLKPRSLFLMYISKLSRKNPPKMTVDKYVYLYVDLSV